MKTTLTFVLAAFAGIGLSANSPAVAQQSTLPYDPAYSAEVIQPGFVTQQPNPAPGNPQTPGAAAQAASPNPPQAPTFHVPAAGDLPIDNGQWDGAPVGEGCSICGDGNCAPAEWYLEQDVRILNRSRGGRQSIGFDQVTDSSGNTTLVEVLNTHSVNPDISGAWGMTFGHNFARDSQDRDHFIEFTFWGLNNWTDTNTANGYETTSTGTTSTTTRGSLISDYYLASGGINLLGFNFANLQRIIYTSSTNNFEINGRFASRDRSDRLVLYPDGKWRHECRPGMHISYLYGLRYFQLNEGFQFHSEEEVDTTTADVTTVRHYTGDYDISTRNQLLGLQAGAEMTFQKCKWSWGIRSKVGPYVNFSDQVSDISAGAALDPSYIRRVAASKHEASLVGEVGFESTYKFRPNLMARAAYDFMWVTGVATAPDQLQFQPEPVNRVNTNGIAFFQGVTLGMEWLW